MSARDPVDLATDEKLLIAVAARVASGLCSNPEMFKMRSWEAETAQSAVRLAKRIIQEVRGGQ